MGKTVWRLLVLVSWVHLVTSCNKNPDLGLGTQPKSDQLYANFSDTTTIQTYNIPGDSIKNNETNILMLGSYVDPIFGKTSASFYTQLNLAGDATGLDFTGGIGTNSPSDLKLDSAVLTLQYVTTSSDLRTHYGALDPQTIKVYPLLSSSVMVPDSPYYSQRRLPFDSLHPIGSKTFIPNTDSNVTLIGAYYPYPGLVCPAHVRIKIDTAFASNILHAATANLASSTIFHSFIPGIYVAPSNPRQAVGQGGILYFDPHATFTKFTLYYRREIRTPAYGDTLSYSFEINTNTAYFNHYDHNYTNTPVASRIVNQSVASIVQSKTPIPHKSDYLYAQSAGGVRPLITLPYLQNWVKNGPVVVNLAQLVIKADPSTISANYNPNTQCYLVAIDSSYHTAYYPIDINDSYSAYGGSFDGINNDFVFNITRHVQAILSGVRKNYGFYIATSGPNANAQRTVLYGANGTPNKIRFRFAYTKLTP